MVVVPVEYRPRGACLELFYAKEPELLLEGPVGTGKTRAILEYVYMLCTRFPGIRVLFVRKTRASLTESVLVTWEQKVIPNDDCIRGRATAENRRSYTFPYASSTVNGVRYHGRTHIVLGGMDKSSRIMSTEYDVICVFEAREIVEGEWEDLLTRNRNWVMPFQVQIADTNPDSDQHWLNRRANKPYVVPEELADMLPPAREGQTQMRRLLSRHTDNPMLWNAKKRRWQPQGAAYMAKLHGLTGPRRRRNLDGEWCGAEGQIWEEFDTARHMVHRVALDRHDKPAVDGHPRNAQGELEVDWYFGSIDWGHRAPGVLQIWGVVGEFERLYRLHEIYRPGMQIDYWAEAVCQYDRRYELQAVVCDPSRDDSIATLNQRITDFRGRKMSHVAIGANNDRESGWDMVRFGLDPSASMMRHEKPGEDGVKLAPKLYLCWDGLETADQGLLDDYKATCTEQEIPGYVWRTTPDGRPVKEEPDPLCPDHGCDAMRYAAMFAWGRDLTPEKKKPTFEPGSIGALLGHDDVKFDADDEAA